MAQKLQVLMTCDLHAGAAEAVETVTFGYGAERYAFELCVEHLQSFQSVMEGYVAAARRTDGTGASSSVPVVRAAPGIRPSPPVDSGAIRVWARSAGYSISERGRIPSEVRAAYDAAHRA